MIDICIFPIPECVTFPGTVFPLHVFEPRYREMINYCIESDTPLAVCHTRKLVSAPKPTEDLKEALSSNQATYRPFDVISAGMCDLQKVTDDGRMYLDVHVKERFRIINERQFLPFQIYQCESFPDVVPEEEERHQNQQLKDKICHRLIALGHRNKSVQELLQSDEWASMSSDEFSFELFGLIHFDADVMQTLLEMDSANQRLSSTLSLLNDVRQSAD